MANKYVDILKDSGFKAVFGDERNKGVIIGFLNAVLAGEHVVAEIEFQNNEVFGKTVDARAIRYDLHCIDDKGVRFVVEMQKISHSRDFFQRSVYYGNKLYDMQQEKLDHSFDASPVYVVAIMEGVLYHEKDLLRDPGRSCVSRYYFQERDTHVFGPDTISCIFVQLGFFCKSEQECTSLLDQWCYSLKHMSSMDSMPEGFTDSVFDTLFNASEVANFDKSTYQTYQTELMTEKDYRHDLYYSRLEGKEEGIAEGKKEGIAEGEARGIEMGIEKGIAKEKIDTVTRMKSMGLPLEVIAKATELSEEKIKAL